MLWDLVEPGCDLWTEALRELRHDFYHLPQYVQLSVSLYEGGKPRAFIARDTDGLFLVPLILRRIEIGTVESSLLDAISPYGYASPILAVNPGCDQSQFLERGIKALVECLLKERVVSLFCRLHPMLELPHEPLSRHGIVVEHGPTIYCDLRRSSTELWRQTRETVRRQIRRVQSEGYLAEEDVAWSSYDDFQEVYAATMRRVGASEWYFFDREHFEQLHTALADTLHLITVRSGSQVVCAGLFSELCGIVQYHLAGTRDGYERCDVSKLLIHYAREWAQERGNDVLHLGGGVGAADDSLLHFKSGFSKLRGAFHTWRLIVDPEAYRELVAKSRAQAAQDEEPSGYFPEYRIDRPGIVQSAEKQEASAIRE
jgi:lipid II:glycine glycyltransferase (peptidoglycan interpeptide bridge formation enzyme)